MTPGPDAVTVWTAIVLLGIGTYLSRLSFIGLIGDGQLPDWLMRLLRYVSVSVMPALVAPLVAWPGATDGTTDPARLVAALVALAVGALFRSLLGAIAAGMATLYLVSWLAG